MSDFVNIDNENMCFKDLITDNISIPKDFFLSLFDSCTSGVLIIDKNNKIIMANKSLYKILELHEDECSLDSFFDFMPKYQLNHKISSEYFKFNLEKTFSEGFNCFNWIHYTSSFDEIPCKIVMSKITLSEQDEFVLVHISHSFKELNSDYFGNDDGFSFFSNDFEKTILNMISLISEEWFFALDIKTSIIKYYGKIINGYKTNSSIAVPLNSALTHGFIHPDDEELYNILCDNMKKGIYQPFDIRFLRDGKYHYYRLIYQTTYDKNNNPLFTIGKAQDVHEQILLRNTARIDLLTMCYNKVSAEQIIMEKIHKNKNQNHAFFIIDIDNFKAINDNLGHYFGDEVLQEVSKKLKSLFRDDDIVARIGGDEFAVFIENYPNTDILISKAKRIIDSFRNTYSNEYGNFSISCSVGIALFPNNAKTYSDLYKCADKALYKSKALGKNQYSFYSDDLSNGTMLNLTKVENADRIANSYFDYELISAVFKTLYERNVDEFSINFTLQYICEQYNADRCYIFETFDEGKTYSNTFEWCKEGISSEIQNLKNTPYTFYEDLFTSSMGGIIYSNDLQNLFKNTDAYKLMHDQGIKSFVHAQVQKDGYVSFFIGLDDCTKARVWSEKEINSLNYIAKIISLIFQSEHLRDKLDVQNEYNKLSAFISNNTDDIIYVSDVDTYNILYLNQACLNILGNPKPSEWFGKKCYNLLQGKSAPCDFCTNSLINDNDFYEWTYFNPIFNKTFLLKDKLILMKDKLVRLEIATDITKVVNLESELHEKLDDERLLVNCINMLHSGNSPEVSIDNLLKLIANYHHAERSYIFAISKDKQKISNTYEWCAEGVTPLIDVLQNIPLSEINGWFEMYEKNDVFALDCLNDKQFCTESTVYKLLKLQDINFLITASLKDSDGNYTGFIGVDNPSEYISKTSLLASVSRFIANFIDETELLSTLSTLSYYDVLTGVKNRNSYRKALKELDLKPINSLGVAYIDISKLKAINDMHGNDAGDRIITQLAKIITSIFGEDTYRVGGDEFVVLKENISELDFENTILDLKVRINEQSDFNATVGYTWNKSFDDAGMSDEGLVTKRYNSMLSKNLEKEIEAGKFIVFLQPQKTIKGEKLAGAEALIRRFDANGSIQPPISFIPFYEKEGLISKIDFFVFETICKLLSEWIDGGFDKDIKISVNCSRMTIIEKDVVTKMLSICKEYDIHPSMLVIEITETIAGASDDILCETIDSFSNAGFCISLDDFGSGYSNLSALKFSNYNEIKIDMGLTNKIHCDSKSLILTKVALSLCSELENVTSVAEGIEVREQLMILKRLNCDIGQGYYFDRPMPISEFTQKYVTLN